MNPALISHIYIKTGIFIAKLIVTDNRDGVSIESTQTITIVNQPPIANFSFEHLQEKSYIENSLIYIINDTIYIIYILKMFYNSASTINFLLLSLLSNKLSQF